MRLNFFPNSLIDEIESLGSGRSQHGASSTFASPEEGSPKSVSSAQSGFGQDRERKSGCTHLSSADPSTAKALDDLFPHMCYRELSDFDSSGQRPIYEEACFVRTWLSNGKPEDEKCNGQSSKHTRESNIREVGYQGMEPRTPLMGIMTPVNRVESKADSVIPEISIGGQTEKSSGESLTLKDADEAQNQLQKFFDEWGKDMGL